MVSKGFVDWLSVKLSLLLMASILLVALLSFVAFHIGFSKIDALERKCENVARVVDSMCSASYNTSTEFEVSGSYLGGFSNNGYYIVCKEDGKVANRMVLCQVDGEVINFDSVHLSKSGETVLIS